MRSFGIDAATYNNGILVYGKMCALVCVGFIQLPYNEKAWKGTRISPSNAMLSGEYSISREFMKYFLGKEKVASEVLENFSERQKELMKPLNYQIQRFCNLKQWK